jgi:hypothetical protein
LRIEDASIGLDNVDSPIESLEGVEHILLIANNSCQVQAQLLRMHINDKVVWDSSLFARGNLNPILDGGQVSDNARAFWVEVWSPETTANEGDNHRLGLIVGEGQDCFGWLPIDQLDAKDLSSWEGGRDSYVEGGTC